MVLFNYSTRELTAKVVYYGPGICGKTTNLQFIHENLPGEVRGKMLSLATKTDRTLFFDFLPIDLGEIRGMKTRVQLYTVPGQVFYNETRKLVLKGVDGIVFVADSQETMLGANVESFKNLEDNLKAHGMKLGEMPHVIQFNKRDLPKLASIEDMNAGLNKFNAPFYESVATTGIGVQDTLKAIVKLVLLNLTKKYESKSVTEGVGAAAAPAAHANSGATGAGRAGASRAATAVALAPEAAPAATQAAHKAESVPKPKIARKAEALPVETMASFDESEIDSLVGEVEELDATPPAAVVHAAPPEEGAWLGLPEGSDDAAFADAGSTFGSNVALEDLLADELPERDASPAPASTQEWIPVAPDSSEFEIDRGFDPEWARPEEVAPVAHDAMPVVAASAPLPVLFTAPEPTEDLVPITPFPLPDRDVLLTEVASDADLFVDPSLEIAHLVDGEAREIVVPVMLGEGPYAKRFKLAIRLRLDAVD